MFELLIQYAREMRANAVIGMRYERPKSRPGGTERSLSPVRGRIRTA